MTSLRTGFPRYRRLTKHKEFNQVLRNRSQVLRQGSIRAYIMTNATPTARLGMIVGKRHFPKAVTRNRIKRLTRESFRLSRPNLPNVDVVIQVFSGDSEAQFDVNLASLWRKLEGFASLQPGTGCSSDVSGTRGV